MANKATSAFLELTHPIFRLLIIDAACCNARRSSSTRQLHRNRGSPIVPQSRHNRNLMGTRLSVYEEKKNTEITSLIDREV